MKVDPVELSRQVRKALETHIEKTALKQAEKKVDCEASLCQGVLGKAQVVLQKNMSCGPKTDSEIDVILHKISKEHNLQLGRHIGDSHITIGKPVEGFPGLCQETMRAKCIRNAQGYLDEIYLSDNFKKDVYIYNAKGVLKKHFTASDMAALKEYKYHPEAFHYYLRDGKIRGLQTKEELLKWINDIEDLFNNEEKVWKTGDTKIVYRALQQKLSPEQMNALAQKGGVFKESSFVSTSQEFDTAKRFSCGNPILKIELPKGSKYLDLDALFNIDRKHWMEQEFLLNKNSEFIVTGFDEAKNIIKVRYLH
ncbi:MAG: hypothetical protein KHX03_08680 [Clostridium sp.]|nr:hypothetical protein [Clostridium sp.]